MNKTSFSKIGPTAKGKTSTLFTTQAISTMLQQMGLQADPSALTAFCHWNGRDYDVLFTEEKEKSWGQSFLLKADRSGPKLMLLYRTFKFRWLGHFDAELTHYLYEGENGLPGSGGNGAVFIRDLTNNTTRTLIDPDNGGQYSLARFCGDGVIYSRKRVLWRVDLNGSDNAPLLSSPGK